MRNNCESSDIQPKEEWGRVGHEEGRGVRAELTSRVVTFGSSLASRGDIQWSMKETHGFQQMGFWPQAIGLP